MLRINLLPSYVAQRRQNKKFIAGWTTIFIVAVALALAFQYAYLVPKDAQETSLANIALAATGVITADQTEASTIKSGVAPIQGKLDFYNKVHQYNLLYPQLYLNIARYSSPKILYYKMSVMGTTLTIDAYTPSIEALGRYLQWMYTEPDITSVNISAIPTPEQAAEKIYLYKGTVIGMSGGAATTQGGRSSSSIPGIPPGVNVTLPAGSPGSQRNGPGGPPGGFNPPGTLPGLVPSAQGPGQFGGGQTTPFALLLADPDFNPKYYKVVVRKTDGFTFVATCTLKKAFAPPAPPSPAAAAPAGSTPGAPGAANNG
jgi:hypothetical protein